MIEKVLEIAVYLAFGFLLLLWGLTAYSMFRQKQFVLKKAKIKLLFAQLISEHLYDEVSKTHFIEIQRLLQKEKLVESRPKNVQYLIDLMIDVENYFAGSQQEKIVLLYSQLPPYNVSYKKTLKKDWHIIARGIRELYEMDQRKYTKYILRFRNHSNIFVRREAQIGIVVFLGWKSLRFLAYLKYTVSLWQQIAIVEKLNIYYPVPNLVELDKILNQKDIPPSGKEILMRIIRKFDIEEKIDYIIDQLESENYDLRETALFCLASLDLNPQNLERIQTFYEKVPDRFQKRQILLLHRGYPVEEQLVFFKKVLKSNDELHIKTVANILTGTVYEKEVDLLLQARKQNLNAPPNLVL